MSRTGLSICKYNHQILDVLVFTDFPTEKTPHPQIYFLTFQKALLQRANQAYV